MAEKEPQKIRKIGQITDMGFKLLTREDRIFGNPISDLVFDVLKPFKDQNMIRYDEPIEVDLKGFSDGGLQWTITAPNKKIAKAVYNAVMCLDDKARMGASSSGNTSLF